MAERTRGMGRGLAAILAASDAEEAADELRTLPVELIVPNPRQPRRTFDPDALAALAASLADRGVLQPVLVRPVAGGTYELIAGERRWRASQAAGLAEIPAIVRPEGDAAALELALVENMVREDLNPVEQARACAALVDELGLTREEVGRRVGRSRVAMSNLLRLLDLPDEALERIERGELTEGHGRALLTAPDHGARRRLAAEAASGGWSVREVERRARRAAQGPAPAPARAAEAHPDEAVAMAAIEDALSAALGAGTRVRRRPGGYRIEIDVESLEAAEAVARRAAKRR
ncbi:MAG: ParB/RepB/Spo0J family partition protein [Solirubrobacteraceae bacterium]